MCKIENTQDAAILIRFMYDSGAWDESEVFDRVMEILSEPWKWDDEYKSALLWSRLNDDERYDCRVNLSRIIDADVSAKTIREWLIDGQSVEILKIYSKASAMREVDTVQTARNRNAGMSH